MAYPLGSGDQPLLNTPIVVGLDNIDGTSLLSAITTETVQRNIQQYQLEKEAIIKTTPHEGVAKDYTLISKKVGSSKMWQVYHEFDGTMHPKLKDYVCCNKCGKNYNFAKGTTGPRNHLKLEHPLVAQHLGLTKIISISTNGNNSSIFPKKRGS